MAVGGVIVVVGAVEVGGHDADVVGAVLAVQELAVLQTGDFRQRISLVGLFQLTGQQAAFLHGLRRHAGIDAGGAEELQLLAAILPCSVDDVHLQRHIVIHKISQRFLICHDAADFSSSKEHILRLLLCKERFHSILTGQIQLLVRTRDDIGVTLTLQFTDDCRTHHAAMTCNINLRILFHHKKITFFQNYRTAFSAFSRFAHSRSCLAMISTSCS